MRAWYDAERGRLDPFMLVLEGSVPNEEINGEGHWAGLRRRPRDRPADHDLLMDRSAGAQGGRRDGDRHVRRLRRRPGDAQQPDRRHGPARLPGWSWTSRLGIPIVNLPGCPVQPNNITETLLAPGAAARRAGADDRPRRPGPAALAVRPHRPRDLQPRGLRRAGPVRRHARRRGAAWSSSGARARWSGATCPCAAGSTGSAAARTSAASASACTSAGVPRSLHALHGARPPRRWRPRAARASPTAPCSGTSATGGCAPRSSVEPEWRRPATELLTGYERRW